MPATKFDFDVEKYANLLKAVASMSRLYSDNSKAFIHSRFVEKLYVECANAKDLSRSDMSFDAILHKDVGVGVKTFLADNVNTGKSEKVAEFTKNASLGDFIGLSHSEYALKASELRNNRIISDANEFDIDLSKSIYHCLVRTNDGALIHEEPYELVSIQSIKPTDKFGNEIADFSDVDKGHSYFTDGISKYRYDVAKNVLYKRFELNRYKNSEIISLDMYDDIFQKVLKWANLESSSRNVTHLCEDEPRAFQSNTSQHFVILPLYGTKSGYKREVQEKSGINQWNAGGRERKFGESYIPIPKNIHRAHPNFFPPRDVKFNLVLPNGKVISAKVCQENNKALMSDPNTDLCEWLYTIIDKNLDIAKKRFSQARPYTYEDLRKVGKDSVKITKIDGEFNSYQLESSNLGSYEAFINPDKELENEDE
jgi:hypothetical protein